MRQILTLLVFLYTGVINCKANAIDSLRSKKDVEKFLAQFVDSSNNHYSPFVKEEDKLMQIPVHFGTDSFYIADADNNGKSDLIVDAKDFLVVLDQDEHYAIKWLGTHDYTFKEVLKSNSAVFIIVNNQVRDFKGSKINRTDTLVYKNEDFVEYTANPGKYVIQKIEYRAGPCLGSCLAYDMTIDSNRSVRYTETKAIKGRFDTIEGRSDFTKEEYDKIIGILSGIRFDELQNSYFEPATDLPSARINIYYNNYKVKSIDDYGKVGPGGLRPLYDLLDNYYETKKWVKKITHGPRIDEWVKGNIKH